MTPSPNRTANRIVSRSSTNAGGGSTYGSPSPSRSPTRKTSSAGMGVGMGIGIGIGLGIPSIGFCNHNSSHHGNSGGSGNGPARTSSGTSTHADSNLYGFRTAPAGTFRNNNPFAQRMVVSLTKPAPLGPSVTTAIPEPSTPKNNGVVAVSGGVGPVQMRSIGTSPSPPSANTSTPPNATNRINAAPLAVHGANASRTGSILVPQPYSSRFGSPPPLTVNNQVQSHLSPPILGQSRIPSPTASPSPTTTSAGVGNRKSKFLSRPIIPSGSAIAATTNNHADQPSRMQGTGNSPGNNGQGRKKTTMVQRKTVPTLSPDTAHAAALPRARSPSVHGRAPSPSPYQQTGGQRKVSPSTLSPPSFHTAKGLASKSMLRQPSTPILRVGALPGSSGNGQAGGRKRSASVNTQTSPAKPVGVATNVHVRGLGAMGLAPALPIFGRKSKNYLVGGVKKDALSSSARASTNDQQAVGRKVGNQFKHVNDNPHAQNKDTAQQHNPNLNHPQNRAPRPTRLDLDVPQHIRARLHTLSSIAKVLGFDQAEVARKIDIPGLLGRVDRAHEKHRDVLESLGEGAANVEVPLSPTFGDATGEWRKATANHQDKCLHHDVNETPTRSQSDKREQYGSVDLLSPDAPLDVFPDSVVDSSKTDQHKDGNNTAAHEDNQRATGGQPDLELDMMPESRFGASPSLTFATFGLGLDQWRSTSMDIERSNQDLGRSTKAKGGKEKERVKERKGMFDKIRALGRKSLDSPHATAMGTGAEEQGDASAGIKVEAGGIWDVPAFGLPLIDIPADAWCLTRIEKRPLHVPLAAFICIEDVWQRGMTQAGIFRLAGSDEQVEGLYAMFNTPPFYGQGSDLRDVSPYSVAHLLKRFLRDLPEPLIDESLTDALWSWCCSPDFPQGAIDSTRMRPAHPRRVTIACLLLQLLPPQHLSLCIYTLAFVAQLQCFEKNRLTLDAIAIIFGPAILAPRSVGVPGVGGGTKGEKTDAEKVSKAVDQSQKCLGWLVKYWPMIAKELAQGEEHASVPKPIEKDSPVKGKKEAVIGLLSPLDLRSDSHSRSGPSPIGGLSDKLHRHVKHSLDIPRPIINLDKPSLPTSQSLSSFGLSTSKSLSRSLGFGLNKLAGNIKASSPLAADGQDERLSDGLKPSTSLSSNAPSGGILRSALSNINLASAFKEDEPLKVPKRSASFNSLSSIVKKGIGMGGSGKDDKRAQAGRIPRPHFSPPTPSDSPLLVTPSQSPDPNLQNAPRSSMSKDGRPSSVFSNSSASGMQCQMNTVLGSLQDLLLSKDRQIERDARELAVLRHTLLKMDEKLSARLNSEKESSSSSESKAKEQVKVNFAPMPSPQITITTSPSSQFGSDELVTDLRKQLDTALSALNQSREMTVSKDKQLVQMHEVLARHRAERLAETNALESMVKVEVAKNRGLREERDLAKVRLEKVKRELFNVA